MGLIVGSHVQIDGLQARAYPLGTIDQHLAEHIVQLIDIETFY